MHQYRKSIFDSRCVSLFMMVWRKVFQTEATSFNNYNKGKTIWT